MNFTLNVKTNMQTQLIDITNQVQKVVGESGVKEGICIIFIPHTTAAVTINENSDPDVVRDVLNTLSKLIPYKDNYRHIEGNSDAHLKASLFGNTATVFVNNGRLVLGTWQSLFFCEFDGPRRRKVIIKVLGDK